MKILLAEDNLTNQKLVLRQLEVLGYGADVVADGQAAVEAVMRSHYDLILMDCQMPILDGFEATLSIRQWESEQSPTAPKTVVVAMTASDLRRDRDRASAVGMDDYLVKPVRKETLSALLVRWGTEIVQANSGVASRPEQLSNNNAASNVVALSPSQASELSRSIDVHLDRNYLHQLSDHNPEFELELLQLFIQDSQCQVEKLRQAMSSQNLQEIEQIAHHIKGASANVGAKLMQTAATQIEEQALQKQTTGFRAWLAAIEASLHQIQQFLVQKGYLGS